MISEDMNDEKYGYLDWLSWYNPTGEKLFHSPLYGVMNTSTVLSGGIGGSGVLAIHSLDHHCTALLSPLTNFMSSSRQSPPSSPGTIQYGIMGNVTSIPAGYSMKTILYIGEGLGINAAVSQWGSVVRKYHNKGDMRQSVEKDITLRYLGYTTDNGAYYYYKTVDGLNYQDTMTSIKQYAENLSVPYKYVLLDSW